HEDVYQRIIEADRKHLARYGVGNAMAQAYNHTILPLAPTRDKRTQIAWGLSDFQHRYGRRATGMWLAETAIDLECLDMLAQYGVTYTVLAPWQAATPIDPTEPYIVPLQDGRSITVFFFNAPLSGGVSFDWNATTNADLFAADYLPRHLVQSKRDAGEAQLILIATDGELYGHHKPWRDKFLMHLIHTGAPAYGFEHCAGETLLDPWAARDAYLPVRNGWEPLESFWAQHGKQRDSRFVQRTLLLLEAQYYQQCSFTSCGFFFEDLDRIEPRNNIAF